MKTSITAVATVAALTSCSTVPDVTLTYHLTSWKTTVTLTQTIGCDVAKKRIVYVQTPAVSTTYTADPGRTHSIKIRAFGTNLADSDIALGFTEDGRLKSVNQTTTGQGESVVKSAVTLAATAVAFGGSRDQTVIPECDDLNDWNGGKPVTLIYQATIDSAAIGSTTRTSLNPVQDSDYLFRRLSKRLPLLEVDVSEHADVKGGPSFDGDGSGYIIFKLQRLSAIVISTYSDGASVGVSRVLVPKDEVYPVPVPKAALFGKQSFSLGLSESGAVLNVGYGKVDASAGAVNAMSALIGSDATSISAKAAELKGQADIIAQQQRLVLCQTKPSDCK